MGPRETPEANRRGPAASSEDRGLQRERPLGAVGGEPGDGCGKAQPHHILLLRKQGAYTISLGAVSHIPMKMGMRTPASQSCWRIQDTACPSTRQSPGLGPSPVRPTWPPARQVLDILPEPGISLASIRGVPRCPLRLPSRDGQLAKSHPGFPPVGWSPLSLWGGIYTYTQVCSSSKTNSNVPSECFSQILPRG